jgi:hypothetical protein
MLQFRVLRDTPECVRADVAFADVPVTIDTGVVNRARVVEMNCPDVLHAHCLLHALKQRLETVSFANVVPGRERVRRVHADGERQLRTRVHDLTQMFEAMADAIALSRSVL